MEPENSDLGSFDDERSENDLASVQREMNGELVLSSLRAHEEAEAAVGRENALLAAAELRERLLGILGHDLRTPLGAILMSAGMLVAHGNLNEDDSRIAKRVLKSGHRMDRMISQILDFTRARLGGGMILELRPTDLGEVCHNVASELSVSRAFPVHSSSDGDVTASLDADRLDEVISNIAGNAVEHAFPGTTVAVHAYAEEAHVLVAITNEGDPIPLDVLPFILEPFRRAKQRAFSKAGNLGLGLYIASEIAQAHGGTLEARSADGKTTFTLRLPRAHSPAEIVEAGMTPVPRLGFVSSE